jgi:ferritin-like metal-binding protein YciE
MKIKSLHDFYVAELRDLWNAEHQLLKALPKMIKAANTPALCEAFKEHLEDTQVHVARLEEIFLDMDMLPKGKHCHAMEGILEEAEALLKESMPAAVKDAALIAVAQRAEHYEIAGYGCVRTYARILGEDEAMALLDATLQEEGAADVQLTGIAESTVNEEAMVAAK